MRALPRHDGGMRMMRRVIDHRLISASDTVFCPPKPSTGKAADIDPRSALIGHGMHAGPAIASPVTELALPPVVPGEAHHRSVGGCKRNMCLTVITNQR
jgi:hypothetical protein